MNLQTLGPILEPTRHSRAWLRLVLLILSFASYCPPCQGLHFKSPQVSVRQLHRRKCINWKTVRARAGFALYSVSISSQTNTAIATCPNLLEFSDYNMPQTYGKTSTHWKCCRCGERNSYKFLSGADCPGCLEHKHRSCCKSVCLEPSIKDRAPPPDPRRRR